MGYRLFAATELPALPLAIEAALPVDVRPSPPPGGAPRSSG
jgi:hypothetical protein